MIKLDYFYSNFFNDIRIIDLRFGNFTVDHLARLTSNNTNGEFNTILAATSTCYTAYFGNQSDVSVAEAVKKSLTNSFDGLITNFKADVSKTYNLVAYTYDENQSVLIEFFPSGAKEYSQVTKTNIELLATRLASAFGKHASDFDATIVNKFKAYVTNLQSARSAQLEKFGKVDSSKTKTKESRTALELQLLTNMFTIGGMFPGQVEHCVSFFNQSLLYPAHHQHTFNITLKSNEVQTPIEKQFTANAEIIVTTNQKIEISLSNTKDMMQKNSITINANEQTIINVYQFNNDLAANHFIVVRNLGDADAEVKLEV